MVNELPKSLNPAGRYNTSEAARLLGVDRHTIMRWTKDGHIRASASNGRRKRYKGADIIKAFYTH